MQSISKKIFITILIIFLLISNSIVQANQNELEQFAVQDEYSEQFIEWLNRTEEEKQQTMMPNIFRAQTENSSVIRKKINNPLKTVRMLRTSLDSNFSLLTLIPENLVVKNQMSTNECWSFSTLASLESNLALQNKKNNVSTVIYDFSERHMDYATTRNAFFNNEINPFGYTRLLKDGGTFYFAKSYLTNGMGAVSEEKMPFENNLDDIDITKVTSNPAETTVKDIKEFPAYTESNKNELIQEMKMYLREYGAIAASTFWVDIRNSNYYNNETGAMYCYDYEGEINHAMTIVGWDDEYPVTNFVENHQPKEPGAWLIKNSWGDKIEASVADLKANMFQQNEKLFRQNGYYSAEDITNEFLLRYYQQSFGNTKVSISEDGTTLTCEVGNAGFMYVSYEDTHTYVTLMGIQKALDYKDYDHIYQHDELEAVNQVNMNTTQDIYIANVFDRDPSREEYITDISINAFAGGNYEVFINPNGNDKSLNKMQSVELTTGKNVVVEQGYHVLKLKTPIKLTGSSFVVMLKTNEHTLLLESKIPGVSFWQNVELNQGESFFSFGNYISQNIWQDLAKMPEEKNTRGNLTIKAFTKEMTVSQISVSQMPEKLEYQIGEEFSRERRKNYSFI